MKILAVNAGSSSVKAALFKDGAEIARGRVSRLRGDPVIEAGGSEESLPRGISAKEAGLALADRLGAAAPDAVAHRIVHGGDRPGAEELTNDTLEALTALTPLAPLHQPGSLAIARALRDAMPNARHIGCFDTAFHQTIDPVRTTFAVPQDFRPDGVRRYGFHGLSYAGTAQWLTAERPDLARVVALHLGSGASLCALSNGRSVATSMGLTPLDGVPMGTRPGALDPGLILYWMRQGRGAGEIEDALYKRSGLLGLSGISNDMRDLRASSEPSAVHAIAAFETTVAETVGAYVVTLGGLDALVFSGGIGENDAGLREAVTAKLAHLAPFETLVRPADEEAVMAAQAGALLGASS